MLTRRQFVIAAGLTLAGPALARRGGPDEKFLEWKPVRESVDAAFGFGGNSMVIRGKAAAALVDCKNAPFGEVLRREALSFGTPLTIVINTHHHADHTGGNHAFSHDLPIIAQTNTTDRVLGQMNRYISQLKEATTAFEGRSGPTTEAVQKEAKALYLRHEKLRAMNFAPTRTFKDTETLDIGGVKAVLRHFGPGHTDNDLVVHLPDLNVLHAGDLLFRKRHPYVDRDSGADTRGWRSSLREAIKLCDEKTVVVPGHGEITDVEGLREQVRYFDTAEEKVAAALRAGTSRDEVKAIELPEFAAYEGPRGRALVLNALYEELAAPGK